MPLKRLRELLSRSLQRLRASSYPLVDRVYLPLDRRRVLRTKNLRLIPFARDRRGGKFSYAEWAHVIGIFQTLALLNLRQAQGNRILDVGCGTGLLGIASEPFVSGGGKYTGLDVVAENVSFCRSHYPASSFEFVHVDVANAAYAPRQSADRRAWPVEAESFDLVLALSVWTHLAEEDARFYFGEVDRALEPGGRALLTFFLLDETYRNSLAVRTKRKGRFHQTSQQAWVFDRPAYGSDAWFHPKWAAVPERAIGVTEAGLERLTARTRLNLIEHHPGNWKELPGVFFQDVLVFEKG